MTGRAFPVRRAPDGRVYLHLWRTGDSYFQQKGKELLRDWTLLKFSFLPRPPWHGIPHHDVRLGLPYPDATFDAAYVLHVLEHLMPRDAERLVAELLRVLHPGGILRVSVPDLESASRWYLEVLEACLEEDTPERLVRYDWAVWEVFEQMARTEVGGQMGRAASAGYVDAEAARARFGDVFNEFAPDVEPVTPAGKALRARSVVPKRTRPGPVRRLKRLAWRFRRTFGASRRGQVNDPRVTGEAVRWCYDRVSLKRILERGGFQGVVRRGYAESEIPGWDRYDLDRSEYGDYAIEPSLYMEAKRPA